MQVHNLNQEERNIICEIKVGLYNNVTSKETNCSVSSIQNIMVKMSSYVRIPGFRNKVQ
jgi:hypothetical protein